MIILLFGLFYLTVVSIFCFIVYKDLDRIYKSKPRIIFNEKYQRFVRYFYKNEKWVPEYYRNNEDPKDLELD
jgi:hypothetical protein